MFCLDHFSLHCIIKMLNLKVNDPLKSPTFVKTHLNIIFTMKMNETHICICIKKLPTVRSIAMKSIRTTILTL